MAQLSVAFCGGEKVVLKLAMKLPRNRDINNQFHNDGLGLAAEQSIRGTFFFHLQLFRLQSELKLDIELCSSLSFDLHNLSIGFNGPLI